MFVTVLLLRIVAAAAVNAWLGPIILFLTFVCILWFYDDNLGKILFESSKIYCAIFNTEIILCCKFCVTLPVCCM